VPRKLISLLSLIAALIALCFLLTSESKVIDFIQYWAGAKLFVSHSNPYSAVEIASLEAAVWGHRADPILLWNTPLIFPLIACLSLVDYTTARILWLLASVCAVVASVWCLSQSFATKSEAVVTRGLKIALLVFSITFFPALLGLHDGQISAFLLLGFSLFLYLQSKQPNSYLSGAALSLTLIKPHLLYLVYLYLFVVAVRRRELKTILGFAAGALFLALTPLIFYPEIWSQYLSALKVPPWYWQTPTIGSYLQGLVSAEQGVLFRVLPTIVTALLVLFVFIRYEKSRTWQVLFVLAPLSLLTSPYGWVFDQILLLPTILYFALELRSEWRLWVCVVLNVALSLSPSHYGQQFFIWYTALVLLLTFEKARSDG